MVFALFGTAILGSVTPSAHTRRKCGGNGTPIRPEYGLNADQRRIHRNVDLGREIDATRDVMDRCQSSNGDHAGSDAKFGLAIAGSLRPVRSTE